MKSSCHFFFNHLGTPTQFSNSNSPVSVLHGTNLYSKNLPDSLCHIYDSRYIDAARRRIAGNTCHVIATHCCVTSPPTRENTRHVFTTHCCVTSPRMRNLHGHCIATVRARTQRKHFNRIIAGRVCWNVYTEPPPSNAFSKSVTILFPIHYSLSTSHSTLYSLSYCRTSINKL
jgi:hypothetical protein